MTIEPQVDSARRVAVVAARAWCRADLAGGTLDIWPLGLLHRDSRTVNVALDLPVEVEMSSGTDLYSVWQDGSRVEAASATALAQTVEAALVGLIAEALALPPFELRIVSGSPRGGGLGASSALAIAVIGAGEKLTGRGASSVEARAALARDLEAVLMGLPTGRQDHYPAQLGGVLEVQHRPGGERVRRIETDVSRLGECLSIVSSGQSHFSAGNNWRVVRRRLDADTDTIRRFDGIARAAAGVASALAAQDLPAVGGWMSEEWRWRRRLDKGISTPRIEAILAAAADAGAWGGKVCGAGGGGCLALLSPPERRRAVEGAVAEVGGEVLAARPVDAPFEVKTVSAHANRE